MALYSDFLITCDFDRTLTAPDTTIPERNLEAIRYFMENGGAFTINTGRGLAMFHAYLDKVPFNAPLLLCNGSTAYDAEKKEYLFINRIEMDQTRLIGELEEIASGSILEFQGLDRHYIFEENPAWEEFNRVNNCPWGVAKPEDDLGPFVKLCLYDQLEEPTVAHLFRATPQQLARFDAMENTLRQRYGEKLTVLRVAPRIIDIHAQDVNKGRAALALKEKLGKKVLICIGDEFNDLAMLRAADYAYCPADGRVAEWFENVCDCAHGAVADVIYKKIPEIISKMG